MSVAVFVDVFQLEPRHRHAPHTPSQLFGSAFSLGSASNAKSKERISQSLRPSILTGTGILPSATSSSNLPAETPMYIAASSRERPAAARVECRIGHGLSWPRNPFIGID